MDRGLGHKGEEKAAEYLKSKGYKILERNCRSKYGEIDIICENKERVVFVEVKARSSQVFGSPLEAVDTRKQQRLRNLALEWLSEKGWLEKREIRFDVIGIRGEELRHIENAF